MPAELQHIVYSSMTHSRIGNTGHYHGGDACLEEVNKEAKAWIPPTGYLQTEIGLRFSGILKT